MRSFSHATDDERMLAVHAVAMIRRWGGILEHPAESSLWIHCRLPRPGRFPDEFGGWSLALDQWQFGHRAQKPTWCYVVGASPDELPPIPEREGAPTHCIRPTRGGVPHLPSLSHPERERTPADFAAWLVSIARLCRASHSTINFPCGEIDGGRALGPGGREYR